LKTSFFLSDKPSRPLVVAEISANHNGSLARAIETITVAKKCGADAVKIQTYTPDSMTVDSDHPEFVLSEGLWSGTKLYDLYQKAHTPYEWHPHLFEHARAIGILLFSTPFDVQAVEFLEKLGNPAYKIASFELVDLPLIQCAARTGKPMILSTGMATPEEIGEAVEAARATGCRDLALLHCISSYPAPIEQANLRLIPQIAASYQVMVGLSDHTRGTTAAVAAVALGARLIEKHFTLSRADQGPDTEFSIDPSEMEALCRKVKEAYASLGTGSFARPTAEESSRKIRRSLYIVKDVRAGEVFTPQNLRSIRPGLGLPSKFLHEILGKKAKMNLPKGSALKMDHLA
jgi:N-acetylneuraminate synthase